MTAAPLDAAALAAWLLRALLTALVIAGAWRASRLVLHEPTDGRAYVARRLRWADVDRRSSMLLWPARLLVRRYLGDYLGKPVLLCPLCMGSLWSLAPYWLAPARPWPSLQLPLTTYLPAAAAALTLWAAFALACGFLAHRLTYDLED